MRREIQFELTALASLAGPLVLTNLGNMALALVDLAIVGRLGANEIAAAGLGHAIFFVIAIFGMGLMFGLDPLIAQAVGAGELRKARRFLFQGLWLAAFVSVPLSFLIFETGTLLSLLDTTPEVAQLTRTYLHARLPSLLPFLALTVVRAYLQAHGHTRSLVLAVIVANLANLPIAFALSFGYELFSIPRLGIAGAGYAIVIATIIQLAISALPLAYLDTPTGPGSLRAPDLRMMLEATRIGAAIGAQFVVEAGSFSLVTLMMTRFGVDVLGAHQVALSLVSTTFQIALGVGAATSVRVGHAIGRGDPAGARRAGLAGIIAGGSIMLACGLVLLAIPAELAALFASEPEIITAAVPLLFVAACFQLSDGVQTIAQGALRGTGDTVWPFLINLSGHYLVGLPLGILLAWKIADLGAVGLWWGLSAGLTYVALAMTLRFLRVSQRTSTWGQDPRS
jgi:MATE family multidrug resistance protein